MNLLQGVWVLVIESLQFLTPKGAHKLWRFVKFPMLSGMWPVSWFIKRNLHPNVHTWVRFGVKFKVHHIKSALHSTLYFKFPTSMHLLQGVWVFVIESLHLLTPKGAHNFWRFVKYPMLFGMGPVRWLLVRSLQPKLRTQLGSVSNSKFTTSSLRCILLFIIKSLHQCIFSMGCESLW